MTDEPEKVPDALPLDEHLAQGYDSYVHGKTGPWTRALLVRDIRNHPEFKAEAERQLRKVSAVVNAGRRCDISAIHQRILQDGLRSANAR